MKKLYFIAIPIPEPYSSDIVTLKKELAQNYESKHSLKTIPHITLQMPVRVEEEHESDFIKALQKAPIRIEKDEIILQDVGHFGEKTIYIDVRKEGLVVQLFNAVSKCLRELVYFPHDHIADHFHPHITLMTRDLSKKMFLHAFPELLKLKFDWEIPIDRFNLFKHDGKKWNVLCEIHLSK